MKRFSEQKFQLINSVLVGIFIVALAGCATRPAKDDKLTIVTTTGMIADAAKNIAGDSARVIALMGPGVDPHLYKATHGDLEKLTSADVIFYNGLHLEGKMGEVLEKLGRTREVVAVSTGIPDTLLRTAPGFQGAHDPHIWFDVALWSNAVQRMISFMAEYDSANASMYRKRGAAYLAKLDSLHQAVAASIAQIPDEQRVLITAHDAFGYFGDAYDIEVRGLQGISTVSEFGLRDVTELVDFIIARKISAIFVESSVSGRSIEAVVEGCRKQHWNVSIGGTLYSDAMGPEGTPEGTYVGMVDANVRSIVEALK